MNNKERCKLYYYNHREEQLAKRKEYALIHQDEIKARRRKYKESGRKNEVAATWREKNRGKLRQRAREYRQALKYEVLSYYSVEDEPVCEFCLKRGERVTNINLLTIDHIKNDGNEHRKKVGSGHFLYRWLKRNNFPDGFRVLCFGCNTCERRRNY